MGKQKREKQTAVNIPPSAAGVVTHEPVVTNNWPHGHVAVKETGARDDECILVTIHGVKHYLHSSTAYELQKMLTTTIADWDKKTKAYGLPGVL